MLEAALAAGVTAAGGDVLLGGVLPTPAAPLLLRRYGFDLAAVISASHNPYRDNGIKFFAADGFKLSDETEAAIEARWRSRRRRARGSGRVRALHGTQEDYLRALHERFADLDLTGLDVALDCAHGATYRAAPEIFRRLGADRHGARRRARRAQHQRWLRLDARRDAGRRPSSPAATHVGFALDGDGDRVLAVDRNGIVVDGDELIALAALHLRAAGRLPGDGVAVTVMTNYGFHVAMRDAGVEVATTPGRRPLRPRGPARARLDARRRAVRPHHRHGLQRHRRRHRLGAAHAGGAARARTWPTATPWRSCPSASSTCACATATRRWPSRELAEAQRARGAARWRAAGACCVRPSGTEQLVRVMVEAPTRRRGRRGLRAPRRHRPRRRLGPRRRVQQRDQRVPSGAQDLDQRGRRDHPRALRAGRGTRRAYPPASRPAARRRARATARRRAGRTRRRGGRRAARRGGAARARRGRRARRAAARRSRRRRPARGAARATDATRRS